MRIQFVQYLLALYFLRGSVVGGQAGGNTAPRWQSPGSGFNVALPDLAPVGFAVLGLSATDDDPAHSLFGQVAYSLVSVSPEFGAPLFAVGAGGSVLVASDASAAWRGGARSAAGVPFTLVVRARDCGGAAFGLSPAAGDLAFNVTGDVADAGDIRNRSPPELHNKTAHRP